MSKRRYKVGDYVVLNDHFAKEYYGKNTGNAVYVADTILVIVEVEPKNKSTDFPYSAKIPPLMGDFNEIWISDIFINHDKTDKLFKEL